MKTYHVALFSWYSHQLSPLLGGRVFFPLDMLTSLMSISTLNNAEMWISDSIMNCGKSEHSSSHCLWVMGDDNLAPRFFLYLPLRVGGLSKTVRYRYVAEKEWGEWIWPHFIFALPYCENVLPTDLLDLFAWRDCSYRSFVKRQIYINEFLFNISYYAF